jgi:hypothetical protein
LLKGCCYLQIHKDCNRRSGEDRRCKNECYLFRGQRRLYHGELEPLSQPRDGNWTLILIKSYIEDVFHCYYQELHRVFLSASLTMGSNHPYQALAIDDRVKRVLAKTPLIDGHNDLPQQPRACFHGKIHNNDKFDLAKGFERGMTDIPRLKQGNQANTRKARA